MIYLKVAQGICFLHSLFELYFVMEHFLKSTPKAEYQRKIKIAWFFQIFFKVILLIVACLDVTFDYILPILANEKGPQGED